MTKGTPSKMGGGKTHIRCRRCGRRSYHASRGICASCGFGATAKRRKYAWAKRSHRVPR